MKSQLHLLVAKSSSSFNLGCHFNGFWQVIKFVIQSVRIKNFSHLIPRLQQVLPHITSSTQRNKISKRFWKCAIANRINQFGRPGRYLKADRKTEKTKTTPPTARERTLKYLRNRHALPSPSEDVPANSRARRMAQKTKKLRSLHVLHVPSCKSKTRWHWSLMLYHICGFCRYLVMFDLVFFYFRSYSLNKMQISWTPVFRPREYLGSHRNVRNLRIRFYRLVGRVRTLRVPARHLGALIWMLTKLKFSNKVINTVKKWKDFLF